VLQLQLHSRQPLLQLHEPVGEGGKGFRQSFGAAANAKRNGFRHRIGNNY